MFLNLKTVLQQAQKKKFAVPAFNIYNLEITQAVTSAAKIESSPIILAVSEKAINYASLEAIIAIAKIIVDQKKIKAVLHLDHGRDLDLIKKAIISGFSSIMFDGSKLSFEENIKQTKSIVKLAHQAGLSVEGELGSIGGQEDYLKNKTIQLANPAQVYQFVEETGVDALAVGLGTSHGLPLPNEHIEFELLRDIRRQVNTPLVLHGASNLSPTTLKTAIKNGICKINFDTELRQAFTDGVRSSLEDLKLFDPRQYLSEAKEQALKRARMIINILGSNNQI